MPTVSRENARVWLLFVILFITLMSRNDAPGLITNPFFGGSRFGRLRDAHGVLNGTKWGDFSPGKAKDGAPPWQTPRYLNLTGFRHADGYAWDDLAYFKDRCHQWSRHAYPPPKGAGDWEHGPISKTWQNATGTVHGKWVRRPGSVVKHAGSYNLSAIAPGIHWLDDPAEWGWNVTGSHGNIFMRLSEDAKDAVYEEETVEGKQPSSGGLAREISAVANIQDEEHWTSSFAIRLHGVHWPKQGSILMTTTSEKFDGVFGLPHLVPSSEFYHTGQKLLNRTLGEVLTKKERSRFSDASNPWTPVVEEQLSIPLPRCEYIMYLQLHPLDPLYIGEDGLDGQLAPIIDQWENELRFPTGAPLKGKPELRMSLVAWSPDCGYYLESKGPPLFPSVEGNHLVGVKTEILLSRTKSWMFGFAAVLMAQLWLLKTQMKESNTPSTLGRISFHTAGMMLLCGWDVLGPRFGLPVGWMPAVWEYHPVLREGDVEAGGLPIGLVSSLEGVLASPEEEAEEESPVAARRRSRSWSRGSAQGGGGEDSRRRTEREKELQRHGMVVREIDCAICTEVLEVPVVRANAKDPAAAGGLVEPSSTPDTANAPPSTANSYTQPLPREFPPGYDLVTCAYRHEVLAMVPQADEADVVPVALCHWDPPTVSHVEVMAELPPRLFSVIKDSKSLGTFCFPDYLDVAATLSDLLAALQKGSESAAGSEPTSQLLASLMGGLEVSGEGSFLQFFSFPLYSESPRQILGHGLSPIWKWAKPESIYRKEGPWETSLHQALDDGEWNGGRNLLLLTRGVSEETLKAMESKDDEPSSPESS
ncbi:hypothetical protein CHGG_02534 [Chaetomium globosum CBS 148.51]|uniref:Uncharacterized protein n=1 Tax=Chaetomium globosum (strain ATCC 6205 / CBS 148.51 / DSM 1962 / NBRC 6347 / NRRL 1970) TaxID=306901 RepID=Q2HB70_CHAGB|nr:uncharacterized protein CHGG_02534 [Chaetomium globosum CBS 148.51]EAQ90599.1 hypothetical protein CHGG_02534 [Chaetomium globosum CBS 148.51]